MKYEICLADPAGNKTAFVRNKVAKQDYASLANKIMAQLDYGIEQVGYLVAPINGGIGRLEMMGNEFCGNASRSFGLLLVKENSALPATVEIEVSGLTSNLEVETDLAASSAQVAMPLLEELTEITVNGKSYPVVVLEGISHVIIKDEEASEQIIQQLMAAMQEKFSFEALGLMFVNDNKMYPVVYVVETASLIHESSCGSGTIAYAYYLTSQKNDGDYSYQIEQPGGTIAAKVKQLDEKIVAGYIGGKITLSDFFEVEIV